MRPKAIFKRIMPSSPVAAIDLGSNTVRLLVASEANGRIQRILAQQESTRLSENLQPDHPLHRRAAERTYKVVDQFQNMAIQAGAVITLVGATMAIRLASDGSRFLSRIADELNVQTRILTGDDEARLTVAGVLTALEPGPETNVIFDLGGRSTEFAIVQNNVILKTISLSVGSVGLTEAHVRHDPPQPDEMDALRNAVAHQLNQGLSGFEKAIGKARLVGTAGTTTTLAAMDQRMVDYQRELIDNYRLERKNLLNLLDRMLAVPTSKRAQMPGLPKTRADIIPAGALTVLTIMDYFKSDQITACDAGLLEGIWLVAAGLKELD
jgi:exopolyphosphatase/guanosine-5'-triphosphate,3'-diphosphate pyrophosphatase